MHKPVVQNSTHLMIMLEKRWNVTWIRCLWKLKWIKKTEIRIHSFRLVHTAGTRVGLFDRESAGWKAVHDPKLPLANILHSEFEVVRQDKTPALLLESRRKVCLDCTSTKRSIFWLQKCVHTEKNATLQRGTGCGTMDMLHPLRMPYCWCYGRAVLASAF